MSALGQKRTFLRSVAMSAIPPKADINGRCLDVTVALAKQLKRELPRPSLRDMSADLFARGHATPAGKAYSASAVQFMLG
jgi:hypothetical protein